MNVIELIKRCFRPRYQWRDEDTGKWLSDEDAKDNPKAMRTRILFPRGGHHR